MALFRHCCSRFEVEPVRVEAGPVTPSNRSRDTAMDRPELAMILCEVSELTTGDPEIGAGLIDCLLLLGRRATELTHSVMCSQQSRAFRSNPPR